MTPSDPNQPLLHRLSPGHTNPILVADFQPLSDTPRLSEMLAETIHDKPIFQIDPITELTGSRHYIPLPELATTTANHFLDSGANHGHITVIGHCSSSALAVNIADRLAPTHTVTAVLVQPAWPDDTLIRIKFNEYLAKFSRTTRPLPDLNVDPSAVITTMEQLFHNEISTLAATLNLASAVGAFTDLLLWYRAWLAFLLACRNDSLTAPTTNPPAITILTDSPTTATVKGRHSQAYEILQLPGPQPPGPITPELANLIATHIQTVEV
jgi:hypothetical protein